MTTRQRQVDNVENSLNKNKKEEQRRQNTNIPRRNIIKLQHHNKNNDKKSAKTIQDKADKNNRK